MWRFGDVEVDGARREVRRAGEPVHLEPQAFDLLRCLLEHRDRVVTKEELLDGVWGHRFLSEANLTTRVKEVRRAVGDDGASQHVIRNLRGRGYRFVADVHEAAPGLGLVGRAADLEAVRDALRRGPLVTLVGPGGVGKSSLARALVLGTAAWVVDLSTLEAGADVLAAVARSAAVELQPGPADGTFRALAGLEGVLVLDGCEHLVEHVTDLAARLLDVVEPRLRIVATSQVALGVSGEIIVELGPLGEGDARALFVERGLAARPAWEPVGDERIDALTAALDRLPLTIEMAAARLRSMTFEDLEGVVVSGGLVRVSHRTPTARHRSLGALTGWSVQLLEPRHRQALTDFAVFAGPVDVGDAAAVLRPDDPTGVAVDLAALAERSLVVADLDASRTRYSMLSTVRAVVGPWLAASESGAAVRARHAEHVVASLREVDDLLRTPSEATGRRRLDELVDEVRAADRWARRDRPELSDEIGTLLFHPAYRALWHEPAAWSREAGRPSLVAAASDAHRGALDAARSVCEPMVSAAAGRLRATASELLADVAMYQGDLATVARCADALVRLGDELGDGHAATLGVVDRALARAYGGDPSAALDDLGAAWPADALAPTDVGWLAYARGEVLAASGDPLATESFEQAIEVARPVGNRFIVSVASVSLADALARRGDVERSLAAYGAAIADFGRHGNAAHAVTAIRNLVALLVEVGDAAGAARLHGSVSAPGQRPAYGAEAERTAGVLEGLRRRVGAGRLATWMAEGQARSGDPVGLARDVLARHAVRRTRTQTPR